VGPTSKGRGREWRGGEGREKNRGKWRGMEGGGEGKGK